MALERITSNITREAVLTAMAEYDEIKQPSFLKKYGFKPARTYRVTHEGKSYDSKAIVGAAFGYLEGNPPPLRYDEFSGGQVYVIPVLERLGSTIEAGPEALPRNPNWSREELILALDLYFRNGGRDPGDTHPDVLNLSALLQRMATQAGLETFRNGNGVAMKLMNFRSLDPAFLSKGGKGLAKARALDRQIWDEFAGARQELALAALAIREGLTESDDEIEQDENKDYQAKEGKVSYRKHKVLERNRKLVALRKMSALKQHGKLECEACGFDFRATYGDRRSGYIEAHHTNPVHAMQDGDVTKLNDIALLCANCHGMVHSAKPWLSLPELRRLLS